MKKPIYVLIVLLFVTGCVTTYKTTGFGSLTIGMNKAQVRSILGPPVRVLAVSQTREGFQEVLEYITPMRESYALVFWNDYLTGYEFLYDNIVYVPAPVRPAIVPGYGKPVFPGYRPNRPYQSNRPNQPNRPNQSTPNRPNQTTPNRPNLPNQPGNNSGRPNQSVPNRPNQSGSSERPSTSTPNRNSSDNSTSRPNQTNSTRPNQSESSGRTKTNNEGNRQTTNTRKDKNTGNRKSDNNNNNSRTNTPANNTRR